MFECVNTEWKPLHSVNKAKVSTNSSWIKGKIDIHNVPDIYFLRLCKDENTLWHPLIGLHTLFHYIALMAYYLVLFHMFCEFETMIIWAFGFHLDDKGSTFVDPFLMGDLFQIQVTFYPNVD